MAKSPSQKSASLTRYMVAKWRLKSLQHPTEVLTLYPQKGPHSFLMSGCWLDVLMSACLTGFWSVSAFASAFCFPLLKILMLESHLLNYFHENFNFFVRFFKEPCHLLLCLFLEVIKLLPWISLFVSYICSIYYRKYINSETIKSIRIF